MILINQPPKSPEEGGDNHEISGSDAKKYFQGYTQRRNRLITLTEQFPYTDDAKTTNDEPTRGWAYPKAAVERIIADVPDGQPVYIYFGVGPKSDSNGTNVTHVIISAKYVSLGASEINNEDTFGIQHGEAM